MKPDRNLLLRLALAGYLIGILAGVISLLRTHAYTAGFSGADEPAHFLNTYFISIYLKSHLGTNPLAFASDFYIHYPKISIGHWPPAYYALLSPLFLFFNATVQNALIINLVISALPAVLVAVALTYLVGARTALLGTFVYAFAPIVLEGYAYFMLDQALATCCVAGALAWYLYASQPGWARSFLFAGLCAFGILLKGNGWLIVLVPIYHIILTSNYRLLKNLNLYAGAIAALVLVVPWYWLTASISADGFNYQPGLAYALRALKSNLGFMSMNVGPASFVMATFAIFVEFKNRALAPARWSAISVCISLILATLTLQSAVPVDIVDRYLAPALPPFLILVFVGFSHCFNLFSNFGQSISGKVFLFIFTVSLIFPGFMHLANRHSKPDYRMADISNLYEKSSFNSAWIIDGTSNAEGSFIAAMAIKDPSLQNYALRASKLFSDSNFMGSSYKLKFHDDSELVGELKRMGVKYVVVAQGEEKPFPHSIQLMNALSSSTSTFKKIASFKHNRSNGVTDLYESSENVIPNVKAIRQSGIPAKASELSDKLN
jgi:hypothetical protein